MDDRKFTEQFASRLDTKVAIVVETGDPEVLVSIAERDTGAVETLGEIADE